MTNEKQNKMENEEQIRQELIKKFWIKPTRLSCCGGVKIAINPKKEIALIVAEEEYHYPDETQLTNYITLYDLKKEKNRLSEKSSTQNVRPNDSYYVYNPEYTGGRLYLSKVYAEYLESTGYRVTSQRVDINHSRKLEKLIE